MKNNPTGYGTTIDQVLSRYLENKVSRLYILFFSFYHSKLSNKTKESLPYNNILNEEIDEISLISKLNCLYYNETS